MPQIPDNGVINTINALKAASQIALDSPRLNLFPVLNHLTAEISIDGGTCFSLSEKIKALFQILFSIILRYTTRICNYYTPCPKKSDVYLENLYLLLKYKLNVIISSGRHNLRIYEPNIKDKNLDLETVYRVVQNF